MPHVREGRQGEARKGFALWSLQVGSPSLKLGRHRKSSSPLLAKPGTMLPGQDQEPALPPSHQQAATKAG